MEAEQPWTGWISRVEESERRLFAVAGLDKQMERRRVYVDEAQRDVFMNVVSFGARTAPQLVFVFDERLERADRIEAILRDVIPEEEAASSPEDEVVEDDE